MNGMGKLNIFQRLPKRKVMQIWKETGKIATAFAGLNQHTRIHLGHRTEPWTVDAVGNNANNEFILRS